jgi:hypothetical protein
MPSSAITTSNEDVAKVSNEKADGRRLELISAWTLDMLRHLESMRQRMVGRKGRRAVVERRAWPAASVRALEPGKTDPVSVSPRTSP